MRILSADFVTSAAAGWAPPRDADAVGAFVGRSNVGKSSLINALCRTKIARTSAAPGKTRLANIYRVELEGLGGPGGRTVYLVDLPGYGYARGGRESARELAAIAEAYFASARRDAGRAPTACTLLLVDSRHPGLEADRRAFDWLTALGEAPAVVATKVDKLSRAGRTRNLREIARGFGRAPAPVSSATGEGLDALWKLIVMNRTEDRT